MYNTRQFQDLKEGEIAGMGTINPIVRFLRNIRTTSQNVHIDGNPMGGIDIAVDQQQGGGGTSSLYFAFQAAVSGSVLSISEGRVHLPSGTLQAAQASFNVDSTQMCYYVECTSSSASVARASSFPNILDSTSGKMFLPLLVASTAGIVYRHIGDYSFDWLPYFWMSGYDSSKAQALMHSASGAPTWIDTGVCS